MECGSEVRRWNVLRRTETLLETMALNRAFFIDSFIYGRLYRRSADDKWTSGRDKWTLARSLFLFLWLLGGAEDVGVCWDHHLSIDKINNSETLFAAPFICWKFSSSFDWFQVVLDAFDLLIKRNQLKARSGIPIQSWWPTIRNRTVATLVMSAASRLAP